MSSKLIVGLGNPGATYKKTRHNIGFEVLDLIASDENLKFSKGKGKYNEVSFFLGTQKLILAKPLTFMNLSGFAVRQLLDFYKIEVEDLLVVCDDVNISFGKLRIRTKGSAGGNNGLKSIIQHLHTNEFSRLRIGVGVENNPASLANFVLGKFSEEETENLEKIKKTASKAVLDFCKEDINILMTKFNSFDLA
ncbi:MAG: aminoacyl-tRNA hydrolase [Calditrichaeota bacterium]|nr:MAG: aminoacyl-tRNA hydrolase [Calditrichota bacterium]